MRQRIDLDQIYAVALAQVDAEKFGESELASVPMACPFTLDQMLSEKLVVLEAVIAR